MRVALSLAEHVRLEAQDVEVSLDDALFQRLNLSVQLQLVAVTLRALAAALLGREGEAMVRT